jgi:predicted nucleic acid-binding protein
MGRGGNVPDGLSTGSTGKGGWQTGVTDADRGTEMILYYLDASAWVKRYCAEEGTAHVAGLFAAGASIGCSALGLVEVLSTLTRKGKAGDLPMADSRRTCRDAELDFGLFHKVFLTPALLKRACECARRYGLRGADTVHLASCLELRRMDWGGEAEVVMVSSDIELLAGAQACGLASRNPEEGAVLLPAP